MVRLEAHMVFFPGYVNYFIIVPIFIFPYAVVRNLAAQLANSFVALGNFIS